MRLYLWIIGVCTVIISAANAYFRMETLIAIALTVLSVVVCIIIDAIVAGVVRMFPASKYSAERRFFRERGWERKLYRKIGVNRWKDKIPETGKLLVKFSKTEVADKTNLEYIRKFIAELGYAEVMHWLSLPAGYLVIFILPLNHALYIGIPVATVNLLLQIPPAIVQRYNRPRLLTLYNRAQKRQSPPPSHQ